MVGKGSKRSGNTITLDDTDEEDVQIPPALRNSVSKRRRTILDDDDDDDDDDEVEIVPQTRTGNSNRLVIFISLSNKDSALRRFDLNFNILYITIKTLWTSCRIQSNNNIDFFTIFIFNFIIISRLASASRSSRSLRTSSSAADALQDDDVSVSEIGRASCRERV